MQYYIHSSKLCFHVIVLPLCQFFQESFDPIQLYIENLKLYKYKYTYDEFVSFKNTVILVVDVLKKFKIT